MKLGWLKLQLFPVKQGGCGWCEDDV